MNDGLHEIACLATDHAWRNATSERFALPVAAAALLPEKAI